MILVFKVITLVVLTIENIKIYPKDLLLLVIVVSNKMETIAFLLKLLFSNIANWCYVYSCYMNNFPWFLFFLHFPIFFWKK